MSEEISREDLERLGREDGIWANSVKDCARVSRHALRLWDERDEADSDLTEILNFAFGKGKWEDGGREAGVNEILNIIKAQRESSLLAWEKYGREARGRAEQALKNLQDLKAPRPYEAAQAMAALEAFLSQLSTTKEDR